MHSNQYTPNEPTELRQILETAATLLAVKYARAGSFTSPENTKQYLQMKLAHYDREVFA
ncbi:hypothetical protein JCM19233_2429 [Vibrio astriarenae]|nr:hypothetical protein JCM19233_2429 [Vibrio sp. C7]